MRIAVLVLGLLLGLLMFLQTTVAYTFSGFVGEETTQASAVGILMALLWLVACALVLPFPIVSVVAFCIAALLGYLASPDFPDLAVWASASLVLAVMSFFGWRGKRKADREKAEEKSLMRAFMQQQMYGGPPPAGGMPPASSYGQGAGGYHGYAQSGYAPQTPPYQGYGPPGPSGRYGQSEGHGPYQEGAQGYWQQGRYIEYPQPPQNLPPWQQGPFNQQPPGYGPPPPPPPEG